MYKSKTIGIVGGMGPKAGSLLFDYIMKHTAANCDQEHLSVILISFPKQIKDRTAFLEEGTKENPAYEIAKIINKLVSVGAEVIGIPCNTSHTEKIFNVIQEECSHSNLLNMPIEVVNSLKKDYSHYDRIGVLSTNGTYHSEIYKTHLENAGFTPVLPDVDFQYRIIHQLIYDPHFGLKANTEKITEKAQDYIQKIKTYFQEKNTDLIIFGCTELSMLNNSNLVIPIVDSTEVLAKALIREAIS
jgi:aspartate racemase